MLRFLCDQFDCLQSTYCRDIQKFVPNFHVVYYTNLVNNFDLWLLFLNLDFTARCCNIWKFQKLGGSTILYGLPLITIIEIAFSKWKYMANSVSEVKLTGKVCGQFEKVHPKWNFWQSTNMAVQSFRFQRNSSMWEKLVFLYHFLQEFPASSMPFYTFHMII